MLFLLFPFYFLFASLPPLLPVDIPVKLNEVTKLHSHYKKIDAPLMQRAVRIFFDELDPLRCYFLRSEVESLSAYPANRLVKEVSAGDITLFYRIYDAYKDAILRRRALEVMKTEPLILPEKAWPSTQEELKGCLSHLRSMQEENLKKVLPDESYDYIVKKRLEKEADFINCPNKDNHVTYLALKCITAAFDSHTRYFSPQEAETFLTDVKQQFYGIGVQIREAKSGFTIVKVYEEGPSFGLLKEGDVLVGVDDVVVVGYDITEVVRLLKIPTQNPVKLTLKSGIDVFVRKKEVLLQENRLTSRVISSKQGGIILELSLHSFYQNGCSQDVENAVLKAGASLQGIILDLRGNVGGLLPQAISIAGLFLDPCAVVAIKDSNGSIRVFQDREGKNIFRGPLIVLVDRLSASASELVAQTLQDWGRALVIGDPSTFGKGTYQLFTLGKTIDPEGEFKVTMGCYYTASGQSVQLKGVVPDIVVKGPHADSLIGEQYTSCPLPSDAIAPLYDENSSWFRKKQQRLTCFTKHLPALKKIVLPDDQMEAAVVLMNELIALG